MGQEARPQIVIRRPKKVVNAHHGGSWKIAYADFVTAMMAFFLLMWLIGSTAQGDLQGIQEYFRSPLKVSMRGGSGSGDSSSVIRGGGQDLTRQTGQVKRGESPPEKKTINLQAARSAVAAAEAERLQALRRRFDAALDSSPRLAPYRNQIKIDITDEGLRVQIVDEQSRPMFDMGSTVLKDYTRGILREIGSLLNDVANPVSLAGHTDAAPYAGGERGYSNWELSADRANASRRELVAGGMAESKILRVVGVAASMPFNDAAPLDPANRRISIVVLNRRGEQAARGETSAEVRDADEAGELLRAPAFPKAEAPAGAS
jgi:chemotaxis protein MotB